MKTIIYTILSNKLLRGRNAANVKASTVASRQFPYEIQVITENLYVPWAIDISDEGKLYFTERSGAVRVIENDKLHLQPLIIFSRPFTSQGEGGLMGIALDPNYSQNHYMYVMHSYVEGNQIYNRVVRLVEQNNKASINRVLLDKIPGGQIHNGGRLKIGTDKKLYITTGDAGKSALAQNLTSTAGKILRIELDGGVPEDNPITNSPVYCLGHRNPQGLAWNSRNILYASEHGRLREIIQAKDGSIYITTSNRDGRGNPDISDDKIIRLIPKRVIFARIWTMASNLLRRNTSLLENFYQLSRCNQPLLQDYRNGTISLWK